jgi:carbon starvation protein
MHEELASRVGGGVTLAAGMVKIFSEIPGMRQMAAYWYHFVVMFEALFILTLLETGTRVARFIFEDSLSQFRRRPAEGHQTNWLLNVSMSLLVCLLWGYLVYTGSIDTLWNMMGIANQLLAAIALAVGTSYLLKHAPKRIYALCTAVPLGFVVVTVFFAAVLRIQAWWQDLADPSLDPAKAFSLKLMCALASIMLVLTTLVMLDALRRWYTILRAAAQRQL